MSEKSLWPKLRTRTTKYCTRQSKWCCTTQRGLARTLVSTSLRNCDTTELRGAGTDYYRTGSHRQNTGHPLASLTSTFKHNLQGSMGNTSGSDVSHFMKLPKQPLLSIAVKFLPISQPVTSSTHFSFVCAVDIDTSNSEASWTSAAHKLSQIPETPSCV